MSSTTPNFNLKQDAGSDNIGQTISDLSANMSIIDSEIQNRKTDLTAHKTATTLDHPDGSVTTSKLADKGVTTVKLNDAAVTLPKIDPTLLTNVAGNQNNVFAPNSYSWVATANQQTFTLPANTLYTVGFIWVNVGGIDQTKDAFTATDGVSFTVAEPLTAGTKVDARWFQGQLSSQAHHTSHYATGADPIDVTQLQNYSQNIGDVTTLSTTSKQVVGAINSNFNQIGSLLNVKVYAAMPPYNVSANGTDQTTNIQNAINDANGLGGAEVVLPRGTILFTSLTHKPMVKIKGSGEKTTILQSSAIDKALIMQGTSNNPNQFMSVESLEIYAPNVTGDTVYVDASYYFSFTDVQVIGNSTLRQGTGIHIVGTNTGYYGTFLRTQFAYWNEDAKLESSANAHRFIGSWFYGSNIGLDIKDSNGIVVTGCTFQNFYTKAIALSDSGTNSCFGNMIAGNYFEYKSGSTSIVCGVDIGTNVRTTMLYGNNYTNLRPTYPEVNDNGTYTTRLEWSGTDYREVLKLPNFTNLPQFVEANKPAVYNVYRGSLAITTTPSAKDMLRGILNDASGNPQWIQIPYSMNGVLDLTGITTQNGVIQQYSDGYILVGTNANTTERALNYDTGFKMLRYRDNTTWKYLHGTLQGATANRPTLVFVGMEYYDTTLGKPIWCHQQSPIVWHDATGAVV